MANQLRVNLYLWSLNIQKKIFCTIFIQVIKKVLLNHWKLKAQWKKIVRTETIKKYYFHKFVCSPNSQRRKKFHKFVRQQQKRRGKIMKKAFKGRSCKINFDLCPAISYFFLPLSGFLLLLFLFCSVVCITLCTDEAYFFIVNINSHSLKFILCINP